MVLDYTLLGAIAAFVIAAAALWRAHVPPQTRDVYELRRRIEDAEEDLRELHQRANRRSAAENMAKAREGKAQVAEARRTALEEAEAIKAAAAAAGPTPLRSVATDPEETKAQLRAMYIR